MNQAVSLDLQRTSHRASFPEFNASFAGLKIRRALGKSMSVAHFEETRRPNAGLARAMDPGSTWLWPSRYGQDTQL